MLLIGSQLVNCGLSPATVAKLEEKGITALFPIQKHVFEPVMAGRDLIGRARTGSGKTLAFALPVIENLVKVCCRSAWWRGCCCCETPPFHWAPFDFSGIHTFQASALMPNAHSRVNSLIRWNADLRLAASITNRQAQTRTCLPCLIASCASRCNVALA